ncbi:PIG-L family deacetylase [Pseudomonas sp. MH9.2]|uniref:PIG-L deacetylase family protein n=1 Tax=unclassified Pseudomonas TaxID=196821 RepID=UPI002AC95EE2|nr:MULTISPECIES: PIG-L family deacetylase [unclassified Pseudomonas]MEB0028220.1 PIG-L family deacetylase [Pseudomonas sp. MH9.2]MEE3506208.1 PIG-L family deacetylase [Pseudomonas sp. 10C3]WPX69315.1 PIG-L family deacetylase [Pseudomonas sp. MH9.2]
MSENLIVGSGASRHAWKHSKHLAELPVISTHMLVPPGSRAVIIAPHPIDEVLGFGGLMQQLAQLGRPLQLISVTDGSASHPGSSSWPVARLRVIRPQESAEALHRLDLPLHSLQWIRGGFTDNAVAKQEDALTDFIRRYLRTTDVVFTPWDHDGHCDHDAVGRATAKAVESAGARCHEVPIWAWHWAQPEDDLIPWQRARKILLDPATVARKRHAAHAFASQLQDDPETGLVPELATPVLERLLRPFEVVFL